MLRKLLFFPLLLASLGSAPSWSAYGDKEIVLDNSPLPKGWAVSAYAPGVQFGSATAPQKVTIINLNGAPVGTKVPVLASSPVPTGWIVIGLEGGVSTVRQSSGKEAQKHTRVIIKCLEAGK